MSEAAAKAFHEAYERLAPSFGYTTRQESAVPWEMVPEENRRLMIAVTDEVVGTLEAEVAELLKIKKNTTIERELRRLQKVIRHPSLSVATQRQAYEAYYALRWVLNQANRRPSNEFTKAIEAMKEDEAKRLQAMVDKATAWKESFQHGQEENKNE